MFKRCLHFLKNRISKLTHQIPPPSPPARTPRDWELAGGGGIMKSTAQNVTWLAVCPSNFSIVHHSEERMFAGSPEPEDAILKP